MDTYQPRRVVVTGLGVVAPNGIGVPAFWQATLSGTSGITALPDDATHPDDALQGDALPSFGVAGSISSFLATDYLEKKLLQRTDRVTHFALAALQEALYDAQLTPEALSTPRIGAVIANTLGGVNYVLKQMEAFYTRGPRFMSAYTAIAWLNVANVGQAAIRYGLQGYCKTPVNDTVGGLDALGMAYRAIRRGAADLLLAGGCEALLHPFILLLLRKQERWYRGNDPAGYRPFDQRAAGMILAEGASMCVLEEYTHARTRGAPIYGEIVGYGQSNDATGIDTSLYPSSYASQTSGEHYARALRQALTEGRLTAKDIAYLHLDGQALPSSDGREVYALEQLFGSQLPDIPASVPRTMLGHSYAAAGAIDALTALLALKHNQIPPTISCDQPDPRYPLQLVHQQARPISDSRARAVLLGGRGLGGANVALAIQKV